MNDVQNHHLICRPVVSNDVEALYAFFQEMSDPTKQFFHPHPFDRKTLQTICHSTTDHYFVMTLNDTIIGYSMLRLFGYEIPSFGCCIHQNYRGKGYGLQLTKWTLAQAKELGYQKVILKVYKKNKPAFMMYKRLGFIIVGETSDHQQYKMELLLG